MTNAPGSLRVEGSYITLTEFPFDPTTWTIHAYLAPITYKLNENNRYAPYPVDYDTTFSPKDVPLVVARGQVFNHNTPFLPYLPATAAPWAFFNEAPVASQSRPGFFWLVGGRNMARNARALIAVALALDQFLSRLPQEDQRRCYALPWFDYSDIQDGAGDLESVLADCDTLRKRRNAIFRACWRILAWIISARILATKEIHSKDDIVLNALLTLGPEGECPPLAQYLTRPLREWRAAGSEIGAFFASENPNDSVERSIAGHARCYDVLHYQGPALAADAREEDAWDRSESPPPAGIAEVKRMYWCTPPSRISSAPVAPGVFLCDPPADGREWHSARWVVCRSNKDKWVVWEASSGHPKPRWMDEKFTSWHKNYWTKQVRRENEKKKEEDRLAEAAIMHEANLRQEEFDGHEGNFEFPMPRNIAEQEEADEARDEQGFPAGPSSSPDMTPVVRPPSPIIRNESVAVTSPFHPTETALLSSEDGPAPLPSRAFPPPPPPLSRPTAPSAPPSEASDTSEDSRKRKRAESSPTSTRTITAPRNYDTSEQVSTPRRSSRAEQDIRTVSATSSRARIPASRDREGGSSSGNWRQRPGDPPRERDRQRNYVSAQVRDRSRERGLYFHDRPPAQESRRYDPPRPRDSPLSAGDGPSQTRSRQPPPSPRDVRMRSPTPPNPIPPSRPTNTRDPDVPIGPLHVIEGLGEHGQLVTDGVNRFVMPSGDNPRPVRVLEDRGTYLSILPRPGLLIPRPSTSVRPGTPMYPLPPAYPAPPSYAASLLERMGDSSAPLQARMTSQPPLPTSSSPRPAPQHPPMAPGPFPTAARFMEVLRTSLSPDGPLAPGQAEWWPETLQGLPMDSLAFIIGQETLATPPHRWARSPHFVRIPMRFWIEWWNFSRHEAWRRHLITVVELYGRLYREGGGMLPWPERHTALGHMREHVRPESSPIRGYMRDAMDNWRDEIGRDPGGRLLISLLGRVALPPDDTIPYIPPEDET